VILYSLVEVYHHLGTACGLHLQHSL